MCEAASEHRWRTVVGFFADAFFCGDDLTGVISSSEPFYTIQLDYTIWIKGVKLRTDLNSGSFIAFVAALDESRGRFLQNAFIYGNVHE